MREKTMSYLLDREMNYWDLNKINSLFNPRVAIEIIKITLSATQRVDRWIWTEERYEIFNVKSTYRLI